MPIARLVDGQIVERRDVEITDIPAHKAQSLGWKSLIAVGEGDHVSVKFDETTITVIRAPTKAQLLDRAAAKRWEIETGGITLNNAPIPTDERTRGVLTAAYVKAQADANYVITDWKVGPGTYTTLDAATIIAMANAVEAHVQACFTANKIVDAKINNDTYTTMAQIDGAVEWPA